MQMCLYRETVGGALYYVYTDGDGTRHHFKKVGSEWKDQSGLNLTLDVSWIPAVIRDKADNSMVFDKPAMEFAGDYDNIKMLKSIKDACGNEIVISSSNQRLTNIRDGALRNTVFTNQNNRLQSIQAPGYAGNGVSYGYANGYLTSVTHEDGAQTSYTYNSLGLLASATNHDGRKVEYSYYNTGSEPYRVKEARWYDNGNLPEGGRRYVYRDCLTVVTDLYLNAAGNGLQEGKSLYYHFNDYGNAVSVNDELGYACFAKYSESLPVNHPEMTSRMQRSVVNLLKNHGFEENAVWTMAGGMG